MSEFDHATAKRFAQDTPQLEEWADSAKILCAQYRPPKQRGIAANQAGDIIICLDSAAQLGAVLSTNRLYGTEVIPGDDKALFLKALSVMLKQITRKVENYQQTHGDNGDLWSQIIKNCQSAQQLLVPPSRNI